MPPSRRSETLALLARTHKDLWTHATAKTERARQLKLAHKFYNESYKLNRGYYSGINAATLALARHGASALLRVAHSEAIRRTASASNA